MSNESLKLRELADAIDRAERIEAWCKEGIDPDKLRISLRWDWASGVSGYSDVEAGMRTKLQQHFSAFLREIRAESHVRIETLREEMERGE